MPYPLLLVCGVLTFGAEPTAQDLAAYQEARAGVGRDAGAHLKLALWCESRGLSAEGRKHLALAVLVDPANASARGLMGLVNYLGHWDRPDAVAAKVKADQVLARRLAEYNGLRAGAPETADGQWKLATWCEKNGLDAEARAHLSSVVRLDPGRESAWRKLGYQKVGGRWVTEAELAAEKVESEAQKAADRTWKPLLAKYRTWLAGKDAAKVDEAETALAELNDPRAVPAVWAVFATGARPDHARAVELFGRIDAGTGSRCLAWLAVSSPDAEARRAAIETLKRRDAREFGGFLVGLLRDPIKFDVKRVNGRESPGELSVYAEKADIKRIYTPPPVPSADILPTDLITYDANGLPVIARPYQYYNPHVYLPNRTLTFYPSAQGTNEVFSSFAARSGAFGQALASVAKKGTSQILLDLDGLPVSPFGNLVMPSSSGPQTFVKAESIDQVTQQGVVQIPVGRMMIEAANARGAAQQRLEADVARLEAYNREIQGPNDRVFAVLNGVAVVSRGTDLKAWRDWWVDVNGMAIVPQQSRNEKPVVIEQVPVDYQPVPTDSAVIPLATEVRRVMSCFGAGTLVRTLTGPVPIETLKVGDRVLTQSVTTGELGYQPVTVTHHNPPSPTFLVRVGGDTIVSSPFHRFWVAGKGWIMARDLKGGETLRLLNGPARVESVEDGPVQPVFNLDVAGEHDFFAGAASALVHDNTLPDTRIAPFDAVPEIAAR